VDINPGESIMRFTTQAARLASSLLIVWPLFLHADSTPVPDAITADGGRYYGKLVDGKRQGHGRIEWESGARYEGEFDKGLYSGKGNLQLVSGIKYAGEFDNGMIAGRGRMQMKDGTIYTGEFRNGEFHGQGRFENVKGDVYEGEFSKNELTGKGAYALKDGSSYQGDLLNWRPHGTGVYTDAEGTVYEGQFVNGNLTGKGTVTRKDGSRYEGDLKYWQFHGQGTFREANGDEYKGAFANGYYDGEGTLTYATPRADGRSKASGIWRYGSLEDKDAERQVKLNVETALYNQRSLLDKALAAVAPQDPKKIDMYLMAIAGDGSQEVFRREVEFVRGRFDREFGTKGRSLVLINSRTTVASAPMATMTSIRESLQAIAARMDKDNDILFLFLTSHGSQDHEFSLKQNGMGLHGLRAKELGAVLKETGIRWKVVVVSACYSGGFIDPVKDVHTLVITAARHDRSSFGCADDNDFTYFGRAFFKESLSRNTSFQEAFRNAKLLVEEWETKELKDSDNAGKEGHSLPQMHEPAAIKAYLERWRAQLVREVAKSAVAAD
jgi:hypothetical protein